jgi:succinate dehydrogenase/fumarate reductase flavoprotein subunit
MSESLRNDGRVWVPHNPGEIREPQDIPEEDRDYYLEQKYPSFGNLVPRDVASRAAKAQCDAGKGVGLTRCAVYLDFADAIKRDGKDIIAKKYGNLFDMYELITDDSPYQKPMMIYPASHYTMGGLWGLQPDEHDSGTICPGRSQFFRPRRQSAGSQRSDAGIGRRIFYHSLHHRRIFCRNRTITGQ